MPEAIICAIVTGGLSLLGIIYASNKSASKVDEKLNSQQAVIETKIEELTREVREHNNFARRMPVVEEQIKVINHRLQDLEQDMKGVNENER
nr:MAG TPA: SECRETED 45 KDA PROTEIN CYCLE, PEPTIDOGLYCAN, CHAP, CELL [Caudoviricetes sp.]